MDDFRLAPILDDAALFGQQGQDLFSLDLPPIQDSGFVKAQHVDLGQDLPPTPPYAKDSFQNDVSPYSARKSHTQESGPHHSTLPIASVLNDESGGKANQEYSNGSFVRQSNQLDGESGPSQTLQLPQPHVQHSTDSYIPLIPPLLQGLHDPPPDAGLFPRITENSIRADASLPSLDRRSAREVLLPTQATRDGSNKSHIDCRHDASKKLAVHSRPTDRVPKDKGNTRARRNKKWSKEETMDLLMGVSKHGVGAWKRILSDDELHFAHRTHVDLKDRYRVCCSRKQTKPSAAQASPSLKGVCKSDRLHDASTSKPKLGRSDAASKPTTEDLAQYNLNSSMIVQSTASDRRERHAWSAAEDAALISGHEKHGPQWVMIIKDPALVLHSRTNNDARDRWRNLRKRAEGAPKESRLGGAGEGPSKMASEIQMQGQGAEGSPAFVDPAATWKPVSRTK